MAVTTPRAPDGTDSGRRRRPSLEEGLVTAAKEPFSVRPRSLGGTMRERQILSSRIRSLPHPPPPPASHRNLDNREDEFSGKRVHLNPSLTSYRAYSQRVFQNARKLNCFDESDDARPEHRRSLSFDWSSTEEERFGQSPPVASTPSFHSPPYFSHVTSPESEDDRSFLYDPSRLRETGASGSSLLDLEIPKPNHHHGFRVGSQAAEGFDKTVSESEIENKETCRPRPTIGNDAKQGSSTTSSGIEELFRILALSHQHSADTGKLDTEPATDRLPNHGSTDACLNSAAEPTVENEHVIRRNWTENPMMPANGVDQDTQDSAGPDHEDGSTTETFVSKVTILLQRPTQRKLPDFRTPVDANRRTMKLSSLYQLRNIAEHNDIFSE